MPPSLKPVSDILQRLRTQLPYIPRAVLLAWQAAPAWTLAWIVLLAAQSLLPVALVLLTRTLVDQAAGSLGAGLDFASIHPLLVTAGLLVGVMLLTELLRGLSSWVRMGQAELLRDHITGLVQRQSTRLDLAFYESPEYYDHLHRARWESSHRPIALLENTGALLQNMVTLVAMGAVLLPYGVWLPLLLLISTLPAFGVVIAYTLRQHAFKRETTASERQAWYYDWLISDRGTAAELRLFGLGEHFLVLYRAIRTSLLGKKLKLARDQGLAQLFAALAAMLAAGLAVGWMGWQLLLGLVTLGDIALFFQAFQRGQGLMRSLLENAGQVYANSLFLGDLFEYLSLDPKVTDAPQPMPVPVKLLSGLSLREVSFCYPGSDSPALHDFNLEIPAGQIAAIVGPNGAGKSTLIKLLCRFYDPTSGAVELDGIDLRRYSLDQLRRSITVLFQEPVHFQDTVSGNIILSDLASTPDDRSVVNASLSSGADGFVRRLPKEYETMLGKWFEGGVDLSVGEWQRLALARAFLRRAPLIILDEPTSALDPWAEADWLERFRRLAAGHTALIITHRLTTAAHADVIHVMQDGRIVESGSHPELVAQNGLYARSWNSQIRVFMAPEADSLGAAER